LTLRVPKIIRSAAALLLAARRRPMITRSSRRFWPRCVRDRQKQAWRFTKPLRLGAHRAAAWPAAWAFLKAMPTRQGARGRSPRRFAGSAHDRIHNSWRPKEEAAYRLIPDRVGI